MCVLLEDMRVLEVPGVLYLNQPADDHCFLLVKTGIFNFFSSSSVCPRGLVSFRVEEGGPLADIKVFELQEVLDFIQARGDSGGLADD